MKSAAIERRENKLRRNKMERLKVLAKTIKGQNQLNILLSHIDDHVQRKLMFSAVRPYLAFDAIYDDPTVPPISREQFAQLREKYL